MSIFLNNSGEGIRLAAPSWVIPGTVADNCRYLAGKVDEIGLLFFDAESCLNYTNTDLPESLLELGLSFHIHHPLELPWHRGRSVGRLVGELASKAAYLDPGAHVIHPPADSLDAGKLITEFAGEIKAAGFDAGMFMFENIRENSLDGLISVIRECGFKICLDLGHILAYAQQSLIEVNALEDLVGMLHLNAPGSGGRHGSLETLDVEGLLLLGRMIKLLGAKGVVTVEIFEEESFFNSLQFLNEYCNEL